jgi:hypothetical protein
MTHDEELHALYAGLAMMGLISKGVDGANLGQQAFSLADMMMDELEQRKSPPTGGLAAVKPKRKYTKR